MDKSYKKNLEYYDTKNLGIGGVVMFLFCTFVLAGSFGEMDHIAIFNIYVICCLIASSLYFWPLIQVRENLLIVSIFKKYKNMPIDKKLFARAKLILLIRFSICFYIPIQIIHFIGLSRTDTSYLSFTGFWPLGATLISIVVQYLYMRFMSRNYMG
jgi:Na+/melibiose symporter-like transporter